MVSKAMPGAGDVEVKIGNKKVVLKPTLKAAIHLSTRPGGLADIVQRCAALDFEAICDVIIVGGGLEVTETTKENIFRAGIMKMSIPCIEYINLLANGGRPISDEKDEDAPLANSSQ